MTEERESAIISERLKQGCFDIEGRGKEPFREKLVLIAVRVHLFPFRTQKLSSHAPTILAG